MSWPKFIARATYELTPALGGDSSVFIMEFSVYGENRDMAAFNAGAFADKKAPEWARLISVTLDHVANEDDL